jgi:hypothetical protein
MSFALGWIALVMLGLTGACATQPITGKPARGHGAQIGNMDTAIKRVVYDTCVNAKGAFDRNGQYNLVTIFVWNISNREPFMYWVSINSDPPKKGKEKILKSRPLGPTPSRVAHNDDFNPRGKYLNRLDSWDMVEFTLAPSQDRVTLTIAGQDKEHWAYRSYTKLTNGAHNNACNGNYHKKLLQRKDPSLTDKSAGEKVYARNLALGRVKGVKKPGLSCEDLRGGGQKEILGMCLDLRQGQTPEA